MLAAQVDRMCPASASIPSADVKEATDVQNEPVHMFYMHHLRADASDSANKTSTNRSSKRSTPTPSSSTLNPPILCL